MGSFVIHTLLHISFFYNTFFIMLVLFVVFFQSMFNCHAVINLVTNLQHINLRKKKEENELVPRFKPSTKPSLFYPER